MSFDDVCRREGKHQFGGGLMSEPAHSEVIVIEHRIDPTKAVKKTCKWFREKR